LRIRFGIVFLNIEITTFPKPATTTTAMVITTDGSNLDVTANAEHIPKTCTITGLFLLSGPNNTAFVLLFNNAIFQYFI
jgi:hypothetical protein